MNLTDARRANLASRVEPAGRAREDTDEEDEEEGGWRRDSITSVRNRRDDRRISESRAGGTARYVPFDRFLSAGGSLTFDGLSAARQISNWNRVTHNTCHISTESIVTR